MKKLTTLSLIFLFVIIVKQLGAQAYDSIAINNINARINSNGMMFWDGMEGSKFFVPNGALTTTVFANSIWLGGKDQNDSLYLCAERYRGDGADYFIGPFMDTTLYSSQVVFWDKVWKLNKSEIDYHKQHWNSTSYQMPLSISSWPGNGDTTKGQKKWIAPFFDANNNDKYDPSNGDYPIIRGDQCLFIIYNDMFFHGETGGRPMNMEIHAMVYAYNPSNDSDLFNTLFINYKIYNRSQINYDSTYLGLFSDMDLGYAYDDFIGCDSALSLFFTYNGHDTDGLGWNDHFGINPPVMGLKFLNLPMTSFLTFNNTGQGNVALTDPDTAQQYYYNMQARWKDGSHIKYGGKGYNPTDSTASNSNFMYNGIWTEESVNNIIYDRRGLAASGPFYFPKDSSICFDVAYIYARDTSIESSINLLKQRSVQIQNYYNLNLAYDCSDFETAIQNQNFDKNNTFEIFPNPAQNVLNIKSKENQDFSIEIMDVSGKILLKENQKNSNHVLDIHPFSPGIYLLKISTTDSLVIRKFVKN